jgi:hypothetical protein
MGGPQPTTFPAGGSAQNVEVSDMNLDFGPDLNQDVVNGNEENDVDAALTGLSQPGGLPFDLAGRIQMKVNDKGLNNVTGSWDTEIVSMSLSGNVPDVGPVLMQKSPTLASVGHVTVDDIGGGLYHIDSFFDVFMELSVDGGANWIPATASTRFTIVPEPAILTLLVLGGLAVRRKGRKQ